MSQINRRHFLNVMGATGTLIAAPAIVKAQAASRVLVVGGGFAGATAAKYLRHWGGDSVQVSLIDGNPNHVSCIMSNLVLNGRLSISDLTFGYQNLNQDHGIEIIEQRVAGVDAANSRVELGDGSQIDYDRLILAPGITFQEIPGLDSAKIPHAWVAGPQTLVLQDQLQAMPSDGTFVMTIPNTPYRCPPGPYERACLVADFLLRQNGGTRGKGRGKKQRGSTPKVIVLDANQGIQAEEGTFQRAFEELYGDVVEYHTEVELLSVDSDGRVAETDKGDFVADVLNVIPPHSAGQVVLDSGLAADGRWATVDPVTYEVDGVPGVHVIGDSQGTGQPKSGHMANAQAKICADAALRLLAGQPADLPERLASITTNSACYSPITFDEASWLTAVYAYDSGSGQMRLVQESLGEAHDWSQENFEDMFAWADNIFADTFL